MWPNIKENTKISILIKMLVTVLLSPLGITPLGDSFAVPLSRDRPRPSRGQKGSYPVRGLVIGWRDGGGVAAGRPAFVNDHNKRNANNTRGSDDVIYTAYLYTQPAPPTSLKTTSGNSGHDHPTTPLTATYPYDCFGTAIKSASTSTPRSIVFTRGGHPPPTSFLTVILS